jgi:DNA-binding MarR family transcriptional regulator
LGRRGLAKHRSDFVISEIVKSETVPSPPSVLLALQRATHATLQLIAAGLVDLDLNASEINALANLADGRGRTVSQLGAAVGTKPTTLTSVLDRLERRGHITRTTRAGDRRSVLIELTDSGREAATVITQTLADIERRALGALPAETVAGFHAVLNALIKEGT